MIDLIWEGSGVVRRIVGSVTAAELNASAQRLQGDERFDDLRYIIHDFTACSYVAASPEDLEFMAARAAASFRRFKPVRIAFVGDNPVIEALIDTFNGSGISQNLCLRFDTLREARDYCGVES